MTPLLGAISGDAGVGKSGGGEEAGDDDDEEEERARKVDVRLPGKGEERSLAGAGLGEEKGEAGWEKVQDVFKREASHALIRSRSVYEP